MADSSTYRLGILVGATAAARGLSQVAVGIAAGALSDHFDRRKAPLSTQAISGLIFVALGIAVFAQVAPPWGLLVAVILLGLTAAVRELAVSALVYEAVGESSLLTANALRVMSSGVARIFGAPVGGLVIERLGVGQCYLLAAMISVPASLLILGTKMAVRHRDSFRRLLRALVAGVANAYRTPQLRSLLSVRSRCGIFWLLYRHVLPVIARNVLHVGGVGLGYLSAAGEVGKMVGIITSSSDPVSSVKGEDADPSISSLVHPIACLGLRPWLWASVVTAAFSWCRQQHLRCNDGVYTLTPCA